MILFPRLRAASCQIATDQQNHCSHCGVNTRALFDNAPVKQSHGPFREMRVAFIVGNHADGGAVAVQIAQQFHHRFAVF